MLLQHTQLKPGLSLIIHSKFEIITQLAFISFVEPPFSSALLSDDWIPPNDLLASGAEAVLPCLVFVSIFDFRRYDEKSCVLQRNRQLSESFSYCMMHTFLRGAAASRSQELLL